MSSTELAVRSDDLAFRAHVVAQLQREGHRVFGVASLMEALRGYQSSTSTHVLLTIHDAFPTTRELQSMVDASEVGGVVVICALRTRVGPDDVEGLIGLGIHEIIPLGEQDAAGLQALVSSGLLRERTRRELRRGRERALLKRDVAAGMAAAATHRDILERFCQGMLALGAEGVSCWEHGEQRARLVMEMGAGLESATPPELPIDASHPVSVQLQQAESRWVPDTRALAASHPHFVPPEEPRAAAFVPVLRDGKVAELIVLSYRELPDDSERHALEQLCSQLGDALLRAQLQVHLQHERDADRRLLGVISHDLRNPLNTILMSTSLGQTMSLSSEVQALLQRMDRAGRGALRLVNDLLTFTRASAGSLDLAPQPADVFALVTNLVEDARLRAQKGRQLELQLHGDGRATVDALRLEQAVGNLLSNALTYSPEKGVITVRGSSDEHAIYVDVENRGTRLDPAQIAAIFQPMKRLSSVTAQGSVGLGLFIVDKIMEAHGGRVWVEAFEPDGVRFSLQFPRQADHRRHEVAILSELPPGAPVPSVRSVESTLDEPLRALHDQLRSEPLRRLLLLWAGARGRAAMPHPLSLDRSRLLADLPDMISAQVSLAPDQSPIFTWSSIGPRLERRLRGTLHAQLDTHTQQLHEQYLVYRRCYEQRAPTYDYVRQRGAHPMRFERLLLPMARSAQQGPSDILGIILFQ